MGIIFYNDANINSLYMLYFIFCYFPELSREQLVLLALLVGSDYTTGVNGVGPVTAMEILAAFPPANAAPEPPYLALLTGLKKFQSWLNNNRAFGHNSLRNKLKNTSLGQEFPSQRVNCIMCIQIIAMLKHFS